MTVLNMFIRSIHYKQNNESLFTFDKVLSIFYLSIISIRKVRNNRYGWSNLNLFIYHSCSNSFTTNRILYFYPIMCNPFVLKQ